jgi:hypothetical protein
MQEIEHTIQTGEWEYLEEAKEVSRSPLLYFPKPRSDHAMHNIDSLYITAGRLEK